MYKLQTLLLALLQKVQNAIPLADSQHPHSP